MHSVKVTQSPLVSAQQHIRHEPVTRGKRSARLNRFTRRSSVLTFNMCQSRCLSVCLTSYFSIYKRASCNCDRLHNHCGLIKHLIHTGEAFFVHMGAVDRVCEHNNDMLPWDSSRFANASQFR